MLKMSAIKFDLFSTFDLERGGGLNIYKFEGFHVCAVSILIKLRTEFESLPLIIKVILTINENAWINLSGFLFSVPLHCGHLTVVLQCQEIVLKSLITWKWQEVPTMRVLLVQRTQTRVIRPCCTSLLRRMLSIFIDIDSTNVFGVNCVNALRGPEAVSISPSKL